MEKIHKILVVEDYHLDAKLLTDLLKEYQCFLATLGREAVELAKREQPDLILLDIILPDTDGYTVCETLKKDIETKEIPIIFLTGLQGSEDQAKGLELGAIDFIGKPFHPQITKAKVKNHLELREHQLLLRRLSNQDSLTSLPNRRYFDEQLQREWRRCMRSEKPLCLMMVDIDYFKKFNDILGHLAGDQCLVRVAKAMQDCMRRPGDLLVRYGGEEFACVLPETDLEGGRQMAETMRQAVQALKLEHPGSEINKHVSISLGVAAQVPLEGKDPLYLVAQADRCVYRAKRDGRNRTNADAD